jgi:hypothetical protein
LWFGRGAIMLAAALLGCATASPVPRVDRARAGEQPGEGAKGGEDTRRAREERAADEHYRRVMREARRRHADVVWVHRPRRVPVPDKP